MDNLSSTPSQRLLKRQRFGVFDLLLAVLLVVAGYLAYRVTFGASTNPYTCGEPHPLIVKGDNGECVQHLKWYLNHPATGAGANLDESSDHFNDKTRNALRAFQAKTKVTGACSDYNVPETCSGKADSNTWAALHNQYAPTQPPIVNFSSDKSSVVVGGRFTLTWSAPGADSCTASGEWSGTKPASGAEGRDDAKALGLLTYNLVCKKGSASSDLKTVQVSVVKSAAPSKPTLTAATVSESALNLTWTASTPAAGSTIDHYIVRNAAGNTVAFSTSLSYLVGSLASCKTYSFSVVAVNNQGTSSDASNSASASTKGCANGTTPKAAPPGEPGLRGPQGPTGPAGSTQSTTSDQTTSSESTSEDETNITSDNESTPAAQKSRFKFGSLSGQAGIRVAGLIVLIGLLAGALFWRARARRAQNLPGSGVNVANTSGLSLEQMVHVPPAQPAAPQPRVTPSPPRTSVSPTVVATPPVSPPPMPPTPTPMQASSLPIPPSPSGAASTPSGQSFPSSPAGSHVPPKHAPGDVYHPSVQETNGPPNKPPSTPNQLG